MKDVKIFAKKKNTKGEKRSEKDIKLLLPKKRQYYPEYNKNLYKKLKQKLVEWKRNYYITYNK